MNRHQFSHTEMFSTVIQYMEQHRPIWEGTRVLSDTVGELQENTRLVMDKLRRQTAPTFGATNEKDHVRLELEQSILQMANQLAVLAARTNDHRLAAQSHFAPSMLGDLTRDALEATGDRVHKLVTTHLPALADFGITPAAAASMGSLLEKHHQAKTASRRAIADRVSETTTLPALIRDTSRLLRNQLDKLMTQFRTSHPEFFAGYLSARVVILRGPKVPAGQTPPSPGVAPNSEQVLATPR